VAKGEAELLELPTSGSADEVTAVNAGCALEDLLDGIPSAGDFHRVAPDWLGIYTGQGHLDLAATQLEGPTIHREPHHQLVIATAG
jgi:hypothetical protein